METCEEIPQLIATCGRDPLLTRHGTKLLLGLLFVLHVLFMAFHVRTSVLSTSVSLTSDILGIVAVFAAAVHSFMEDQRSVAPSDILVLYFSASTILAIPRLRSLWQIPTAEACRVLWTMIFISTIGVLLIESARKASLLRPLYRTVTGEQLCGFWSRSFFLWVLPFFQAGYSKILGMQDIPDVDDELQGYKTGASLQEAWKRTGGPSHRLLRASFRAYRWAFVSGVGPRLVYSGFTFCQPFLISAIVSYLDAPQTASTEKYGQALIGAVILVYLGIAVCVLVHSVLETRHHINTKPGLRRSLLATDISIQHQSQIRPYLRHLRAHYSSERE